MTPTVKRPNGSTGLGRPALSAMLATVKRGIKPAITLVIGPPKSGKSTLAAGGPNPIFILADPGGLNSLSDDIPRFLPEAWDLLPGEKQATDGPPKITVMGAARALLEEEHDYQTIALDTINRIELMLWHWLMTRDGVKSIEAIGGGYGKGYNMAREKMNELFTLCAAIREQRGCEFFVTSHQEAKNEHDAAGVDFEKWTVDMHKKAASVWLGGADNVLYVEKETRLITVGTGNEARQQVEYTGRSFAHCRAGRGREAGNRDFLPPMILLGYSIYRQEREKGAQLREALFKRMGEMTLEERAKVETELANEAWSRKAVERIISNGINGNGNGQKR